MPLLIQNLHRYAVPFALALLVFLGIDAWNAMWFHTAAGGKEFGLSVGTIVVTLNVVFLSRLYVRMSLTPVTLSAAA